MHPYACMMRCWGRNLVTNTEHTPNSEPRLSGRVKVSFGICDLGGNLFFSIVGFHLLFYLTDVVGLAPALAGTAIALGRVWDAITDPVVGYISDNTRTRWGRRRPYMFVGAFFLFGGMIFMFTNPEIEAQSPLFIWAALSYMMLNTFYTLLSIPYSSLTPELTSNYQERTVLNGYRHTFAVIGTMVGGAAYPVVVNLFGGGNTGWTATGAFMGAIMLATAWTTVIGVRENTSKGTAVGTRANIFRSYFEVLKQRPMITAVGTFTMHMAGVAVIQASLVYYFTYIYREPDLLFVALLALLGTAFVFIPIWVVISRRLGKTRSYNLGMGIVSAAIVVFFLGSPYLGIWFAFAAMVVAGSGLATNYVMAWSIIPDAVEWDYAEKGTRREGVFYGMWTFMSKLGQAVGVGITGLLLSVFGYIQPVAGEEVMQQPEEALTAIRLLVGPVPVVFFIAGIFILSKYPITGKVYEDILRRIRERGETIPGDEEQ